MCLRSFLPCCCEANVGVKMLVWCLRSITGPPPKALAYLRNVCGDILDTAQQREGHATPTGLGLGPMAGGGPASVTFKRGTGAGRLDSICMRQGCAYPQGGGGGSGGPTAPGQTTHTKPKTFFFEGKIKI